jgi:hypothetical protein
LPRCNRLSSVSLHPSLVSFGSRFGSIAVLVWHCDLPSAADQPPSSLGRQVRAHGSERGGRVAGGQRQYALRASPQRRSTNEQGGTHTSDSDALWKEEMERRLRPSAGLSHAGELVTRQTRFSAATLRWACRAAAAARARQGQQRLPLLGPSPPAHRGPPRWHPAPARTPRPARVAHLYGSREVTRTVVKNAKSACSLHPMCDRRAQ